MRKPEDAATIERELRAVDAALEGAALADDPLERELQELALALRADSPASDPEFAATLERRVSEGFPRVGRAGKRVRGGLRRGASGGAAALPEASRLARLRASLRRHPRRLLPAAGVLASALLALALVAGLNGDEGGSTGSGGGVADAPSAAPEQRSLGAPEAGADSTMIAPPQPVPPGDGGFDPGARERRIERSARLGLAAPADELDRVAEGITAVTERQRGFVLSSSFTSGEDEPSGGSFELRIPAGRLRDALRELGGLASVRSRTQSGQDVTRPYVTAADRLTEVRADRRGLLRRLERADSDRQAEAIRRRLTLVTGEIRALRSQLRDLRLRTAYAAVSVSLEQSGDDSGASGGSGTGDALDDALGSLAASLNFALRALGVLLPLALAGLVAWFAVRAILRRRRESALA